MSAETKTFSESWYRIADQRVALRPHVRVRRQIFRGEVYYVVHDPFNNQFFRLRPEAYAFIGRLRPDRTVSEVWQRSMEVNPEDAPGQEDVLQLLAQLHGANLLQTDLSPDSAKLFERFKKRRRKEVQSALMNVMYARFPLFDPGAFLQRLQPILRRVISPAGAVAWLLLIGYALKVVIDHAGELMSQPQAVLAPANLPLLYAGLVLLKVVHESGHAMMCQRFGGEVHVMGVMFAFLTPMPFVDTTSSWGFRSRWERALVGAGGMIAELIVAAAAVFVWAATGEGAIHSLAYNMIFVSSVSTVLFNANPLLRFDGYYILSDLLEIPNLQARANEENRHFVERYLFGIKKSMSSATTRREAWWLSVYGITSRVYRIFLFAGILLFLAGNYLILGAIMAAVCFFTWLVKPAWNLVNYLMSNPRLARRRGRAALVSGGLVLTAVLVLGYIPMPEHFRAPGVVQAVENTVVVSETNGRMAKIVAASGSVVKKGDTLLELEDPELPMQITATTLQLEEARFMRGQAEVQDVSELKAINGRMEAIEKQLRRYEQERGALTVRAAHDGVWIAPELVRLQHAYISRGQELGRVVNLGAFRFSAVVAEADASRLFEGEIRGAEVRLRGQAEASLPALVQRIIPAEQQILPSAALGWRAGGEIATAATDPAGLRTREPFYTVQALLEPDRRVLLRDGWTGTIRFELPPRSLLRQWGRRLMQLLQKRYGFS